MLFENDTENLGSYIQRKPRGIAQKSYMKDFNIPDTLCKLGKEQSASQIEMELFTGNPLEFTYFMSIFHESVEKKFDDPKGQLTRFIKDTKGEPDELIKHYECHYQIVETRKL